MLNHRDFLLNRGSGETYQCSLSAAIIIITVKLLNSHDEVKKPFIEEEAEFPFKTR